MQFGMFGSAQAKRGGPNDDSGAGFREFVERNVEAESLGYHSTFLVEHHFTGFGQVSASLNLLTWIGSRTTTLRLVSTEADFDIYQATRGSAGSPWTRVRSLDRLNRPGSHEGAPFVSPDGAFRGSTRRGRMRALQILT